jgi:hypothetical protein
MVINTTSRNEITKSTKMAEFKRCLATLPSNLDHVLFVTGVRRESLYVAARPTKIRVSAGEYNGEEGYVV